MEISGAGLVLPNCHPPRKLILVGTSLDHPGHRDRDGQGEWPMGGKMDTHTCGCL